MVFYLLPRLPDVGAALGRIERSDWLELTHALLMTALKVLGVLAFATLWTVPFGIWVAKRPKWSRIVQPMIQNLAAFPAPVIFPLLSFWLVGYGVHPAIVATILMTIGNQWYLLFNVLAGAGRISEELLDVARIYHMSTWQRFRFVYLPTIFPSLVTGWLTAAGGAWNASIVAEIVYHPGGVLQADGIGAEITKATAEGNYPKLVAAIIVITIALVILNRSLWRTMHELVQRVT
jgi:NitT/TauT family transport system permease protein